MYHADNLGLLLPEPRPATEDPNSKPKKILILDDNNFYARCLASLIEYEGDMIVCGMEASSQSLMKRLPGSRPDLLLIDIALGRENGLEVARALRDRNIETPILFASSMGAPDTESLEEIGRCRFVSKARPPREFIRLLRRCLAE